MGTLGLLGIFLQPNPFLTVLLMDSSSMGAWFFTGQVWNRKRKKIYMRTKHLFFRKQKEKGLQKPPEMFSSTAVKGAMYCSFVLHDLTFILHRANEKSRNTYDEDLCMLRWGTQINVTKMCESAGVNLGQLVTCVVQCSITECTLEYACL